MAERYVAKPASKDSPYYYGTDSTYTPKVRAPKVKKARPQYEIGLDGIPRVSSNKATQVENPTQNPERVVQATGGGTVNAFGKSFNMGVPAEKTAYEAAQSAELKRQREVSPFSDLRGGDGFRSNGTRNEDPRRSVRTNNNGVVQTGTQTGLPPMTMDDANKLLTGGYKMNQHYASNQLPTTASSPYAGKSNAEIYNPETLLQHQQGPGVVDYVKLSKDIYGDQSGVESYTRGSEMNKDYKQMDVDPGRIHCR